jgi:GPH family glycoside/pentoside/hexuronide:cation symporter
VSIGETATAAGAAKAGTEAALSFWQRLGWGLGTHGTSTVIGLSSLMLLYFITTYLGVPVGMAGLIILISKIFDVVAAPIIGTISDRTHARMGRRRPFLLLGAVPGALGVIWLFNPPGWGLEHPVVFVAITITMMAAGFTIFNVPYLAMPAEMTPYYHERTALMSFRVFFQMTAQLVTTVLVGVLLKLFGGGLDAYGKMAFIVGGLMFASQIGCFLATASAPRLPVTPEPDPSWRERLRVLKENKPFQVFMTAKFLQLLANGSVGASLLFYGHYIIAKSEGELLQAFGLFAVIGTLPGLLFWPWISRKTGKRNAYSAAAAAYGLVSLTWLLAEAGEPMMLLNLRFALIGFVAAGILTLGFSLLPDTMEYDRRRSGIAREGMYSAVYSVVERATSAIAPSIFAGFLAAMGFVSSQQRGQFAEQPASALIAIEIAFAIVPALVMFLSCAVLAFYDLDEEKLKSANRH